MQYVHLRTLVSFMADRRPQHKCQYHWTYQCSKGYCHLLHTAKVAACNGIPSPTERKPVAAQVRKVLTEAEADEQFKTTLQTAIINHIRKGAKNE